MTNLSEKKCVPCEGGVPPLDTAAVDNLLGQVQEWQVRDDYKHIFKEFNFKNFVEAMEFVNKVASTAESEGHHPDIHIFYNKVKIELWTHAVGGLSENDFILASKIDSLLS